MGVGAYLAYFAMYMALVEFGIYWMHRLLHDIRPGYRQVQTPRLLLTHLDVSRRPDNAHHNLQSARHTTCIVECLPGPQIHASVQCADMRVRAVACAAGYIEHDVAPCRCARDTTGVALASRWVAGTCTTSTTSTTRSTRCRRSRAWPSTRWTAASRRRPTWRRCSSSPRMRSPSSCSCSPRACGRPTSTTASTARSAQLPRLRRPGWTARNTCCRCTRALWSGCKADLSAGRSEHPITPPVIAAAACPSILRVG